MKLYNRLFSLLVLIALFLTGLVLLPSIADANPANTPWPMFHHDLKHTGRSPYLGAQTSNLKWSYTTGRLIISSPAVDSDGTIYFGSWDNNLYAINPNGSLKWSYTTGERIHSSPAIGSDGTIYVGSEDCNLYAINPNGSLKWSYPTGGMVFSSPAIGSDSTIYVGSNDGNLYAINPNGSLKWSYPEVGGWSSPAIGSDGTIYLCSWVDDKLYAITDTGTSGIFKWSYTAGGMIYGSSPAIGSDGTIYFGSNDHNLYAVNPNGGLKWSYTTGGSIYTSCPAIASDGTIYIGSHDNNLYAINPNGSLKWSYTTGASINSSPSIGSDGTIYFGSLDHNLYAINPNGSLKWSYTTGEGINYSSPAIGSDGTIYIGSADNKLYAFGLQNQAPVIQSVTADPNQLWPPNKKPINVKITVAATDPDGASDIVRTTYSVADEYSQYNVQETTLPSSGIISLISDRDGKDKDGRVYTITITVYDAGGLFDKRTVDVIVPHDQGK